MLVGMLVNIAPQNYQDFVLHNGKHKIIYVEMKKALYRMLQLYYKKFRKDLEGSGFIINPCNPCVANKIFNGKQHIVTRHIDSLK